MPFSRHYNEALGDSVDSLPPKPDVEVCSTGWDADSLRTFLSGLSGRDHVKITTGPFSTDPTTKTFSMTAYNALNQELGTIEGKFPCPKNCIPPQDYPFDGRFNSFSIGDINAVLAFSHISRVIVRSATCKVNDSEKETHCIYAVTGLGTGAVAHRNLTDPCFISQMELN